MKHLLTICLATLIGAAATPAMAQETLPAPGRFAQADVAPTPAQPEGDVPPAPYAQPMPEVHPAPYAASPVVVCQNVCVKDRHKIHPCAVPTIVEVPDPCNRHCCVYIEICAPPCECVCVKRKGLLGRKVEFDYGKYEIDVVSRNGKIIVDYDA